MKKQLLFLIRRITLFLLIIISAVTFAQTLVNYPLNNNLNANPAPVVGLNPLLQYFDPPSTVAIPNPNFYFGHLNFEKSGDFLQFSFDVAANEDMTLKVNAGTAVFLSSISGNIQIMCQVGSAPETELDKKNLSASGFLDADNVSFSLAVPQAVVASRIKIRIIGNITSSSGFSIDYFGIDNISLVKETTTITVISIKNPTPAFITHASNASLAKDTDFGSLLTNEEEVEKTYRIKNTGSRDLKISSIDIVPDTEGFTITGPALTILTPNAETTFKVKFAPTDQGNSTAEVAISGNIVPDNPFRFEVKGSGKSCNLSPVPIASYGFEGAESGGLPVALISGTAKVIGNTAANPVPNNLGGRLYPAGNLFAADSPTRSWYVRGTETNEVTFEFGGVDLSAQQQVSINFEVAAFGKIGSNGVNNADYVILQVWNPNLPTPAWINALRLNGFNDPTRIRYAFGAAGTVTKLENDIYTTVSRNNNNGTKYGKFLLNLPTTALSSDFKFRIKAKTGSNDGLWLIDNVYIAAGNAKVKTWNGTAWSGTENNDKPNPREKAVFDGNYDFTAANNTNSFTVCECEVKSGVLTIPDNIALTVRNKIINSASENDFIIKDGGNLIQEENGAINSGAINAEKLFTFTVPTDPNTPNRQQYNYVISPVVGQNLNAIYLGSPATLYHIESTNKFGTSTGTYIPGRALAVKEPATSFVATNSVTAEFKGVPFNGELAYPLAYTTNNPSVSHGYNLVGNPYPSNLDLQKLYDYNSGGYNNKNVIDPTLLFWDNRGNTQLTQQGSSYDGANYAKFNVINGTGVPAPGGTAAPGAILPARIPTQFVKVGTGFMVRAKSTANGQPLYFNNSMRSSDNTGPGFFGKEGSRDRFWLSFTTPTEMQFMNALVYFPNGDNGYGLDDSDASSSSERIYSIVDGHEIAIQGRAPFTLDDRVDLGFSAFVSGTHTISIYDKEGVFANGQNIYLKDRQTGNITNLSEGSYTFEANQGESTGRFEIIYQPETVLVTDQKVKSTVEVYRDNDQFVVRSPKNIATVEVYDLSGKMITVLKGNSRQVILDASFLTKGMYVLRIKITDGEITNKKILK